MNLMRLTDIMHLRILMNLMRLMDMMHLMILMNLENLMNPKDLMYILYMMRSKITFNLVVMNLIYPEDEIRIHKI